MNSSTRIMKRLLILSFLCGCLFVLSTPFHVHVLGATCVSCDETYVGCMSGCDNGYNFCTGGGPDPNGYCAAIRSGCYDDCQTSASNCWFGCTLQNPGTGEDTGSHVSACGHTRSACELACNNVLHQCANNFGSDCGSNYQDCMAQCCE
jgi:hypothetical protein